MNWGMTRAVIILDDEGFCDGEMTVFSGLFLIDPTLQPFPKGSWHLLMSNIAFGSIE
jgi:hypothetical protein